MAIRNLTEYFAENGLFDESRLGQHCSENLVRMARSPRFPHLGILHYMDAAVYDKEWQEFTLSCRGLVVDFRNERLLAIPFFKFFNLGERMAPSLETLATLGRFEATEKLDGSLGIAFFDKVSGQARVTTRGSLDSEHGEWATERLPSLMRDAGLLAEYTFMFEIISSRFQIVVDYRTRNYPEGLYLVGVRENATQRLLSHGDAGRFAREFGLPMCKTYPFETLEEVVANTKTLPYSEEGYVLRFDSSEELMVKVKSPEYLRVHRFISNLDEKNLLEILIAGQERGVLENLGVVPEEYRDDVVRTFAKFEGLAETFLTACRDLFGRAPKGDRKTFALWVQREVPGEYRAFLFRMMDGKTPTRIEAYQHFYREKRYAAPGGSGFRRFSETAE